MPLKEDVAPTSSSGRLKIRRLTSHFVGNILDHDIVAAGRDLHTTAAGLLAALLTLSAATVLMFLGKYNSVSLPARGAFKPAQLQTLADKLAMAVDDKTLFIGGVMIVMGLLTTLFWDSLLVDERDAANLGPLPVHPAAVVIAKFAAFVVAAVVAAVALSVLPAALFPLVVLAKTSVGAVYVARSAAAQFLASTAGCAFVFLVLASFRISVGLSLPPRLAARLLLPTQFALVAALLTFLFALPMLAAGGGAAVAGTGRERLLLPILWFVGFEEWLVGRTGGMVERFATGAVVGVIVAAGTTALGFALALRAALHSFGLPPRAVVLSRSGPAGLLRRAAVVSIPDGRIRASFFFTIRTFTRNPRHLVCAAASLGLGMAVAAATLAAARRGLHVGRSTLDLTTMGLAAQLNLIFFMTVGLRIAATVPAELDASWVFRFHADAARERYMAGTRLAMFFVGLLPILVVLAPIHAHFWGWSTALVHLLFGIVAALVLLEIVFTGYSRIPLVAPFAPSNNLFSPRLAIYVVDYLLFVYVTPQLERLLIERAGMLYAWAALFGVVVWRSVTRGATRLRADDVPEFEAAEEAPQDLGLAFLPIAHGGSPLDGPQGGHSPRWTRERAVAPLSSSGSRWEDLRVLIGRGEAIATDVKLAARHLRANWVFSTFAVATLALGIAATTALYSVLYGTILKPLQVTDLASLVNVYHSSPFDNGSRFNVALSMPDFRDLTESQTVFSGVAAHAPFGQVLVADGTGQKVRGEIVSGGYFSVLGVSPAAGRLLRPSDDLSGAPPVAVIAYSLWQRRFGGAADAIGRTATLAGRQFEIVGVAPPIFNGVELPNLAPTTVWVPISQRDIVMRRADGDDREDRWLLVKARLATGRTVADAQAEARLVGQRLDSAHPIGARLSRAEQTPPARRRNWVALPAGDRLVTERADPKMRLIAALAMTAGGLVLLVACTNLVNLSLADGAARVNDVAIRLALGARRAALVRAHLIESALLASVGFAVAMGAARLLVHYGVKAELRFGAWAALNVIPSLDRGAVLVAGASATAALAVFGLVPALRLTASSAAYRGVSGAATAGPSWRFRRLIITGQVAVSVALMALAALCGRQIAQSMNRDTGMDLDRLALMRFDFDAQGWGQPRAGVALDHIVEAVRREPGVTSVAVASGLPIGELGTSLTFARSDGAPGAGTEPAVRMTLVSASPSLFTTVGTKIIDGRVFSDVAEPGGPSLAVVNRLAAVRLFGTDNAVGRRISASGTDATSSWRDERTVIGVVSDTRGGSTDPRGDAIVYVPFSPAYSRSPWVVVRTLGNPEALLGSLAGVVSRVEPQVAVIDGTTGVAATGGVSAALQAAGALAGTLGMVALCLAMLGLYGVLSSIIAQRTREIGVRVALGATAGRIMRETVREGLRPVVEGLVVGFILADLAEMAVRPALAAPLPPIDPGLLVVVSGLFLAAALIACYLPSRRAAHLSPSIALRRP